jgi:DNA-binding protein H-NS
MAECPEQTSASVRGLAKTCLAFEALLESSFEKNIQGGKMATLAQLEGQIQKLQRRADVLRQRKSAEVVASIRALMQEYGLTVADLGKHGSGKKRGRPAGSKNGANSAKLAEAKSKLPPKYRDPVSGLTWSGHARPPAWIKDAPDRNAFLIDAANGKAVSAKKVAKGVSRASVKKAGRKAVQSAVA